MQKPERQAKEKTLKFPGNKDQFLFNTEVQDKLKDTSDLL